jgi:hypothetical protein
MNEMKYIYEFRITQADGTSVHWSGVQSVTKIREVVEGELKKLDA